MSAVAVYDASDTKRSRSTKSEMAAFRDAIYNLVETNQPCSDRNVYYRAVTAGLIEKDAGGSRNNYQRLIRTISYLRESGDMPFDWITDETRLRRGPHLHDDATSALAYWQQTYRRDLWRRQPTHLEVWVESDSVGSEIIDTTWDLGVNLYSCRGQSSKTLVWRCVQEWRQLAKPVEIIYLGDWDPTGLAIPKSLEARFERYGQDLDIQLDRLAVDENDVDDVGAHAGHAANRRDPNYAAFAATCREHDLDPTVAVEVEAIPAPQLRAWVAGEVLNYQDRDLWEREAQIEKAERESLAGLLQQFQGGQS